MKRHQFLKNTAAAGFVTVLTPSGILYSCRNTAPGVTENSFLTPPNSAKPFTWWHWINGNVTKEGITKKKMKDISNKSNQLNDSQNIKYLNCK